ncbi:YSC84-related protein [Paucibacter sp. AS339]|uniref:YSC84-related protein n=1 Tax=Paucibacter hankyongi TaxID=3133434 RepID=UPI0030985B69
MNKRIFISALGLSMLTVAAAPAWADSYQNTVKAFAKAEESGKIAKNAYGYAVFPTIGKAGIGIGGAYGKGRVYEQGKYIGNTSMTQVSVGFQLGGQGFSQIIYFEDQAALKTFTKGEFEFGAEASAVAITAGAGAKTSTTGSSAQISGDRDNAKSVGAYNHGMAVFTLPHGGLMYEATVSGQKFNYKKKK